MHHAIEVLRNHPHAGRLPLDEQGSCLEACHDCAASCRACGDACLAEDQPGKLTRCVQLNLDCAAICEATAIVVARASASDPELLRAQLEACAVACAACAVECERHAPKMAHCRACARACRRCEETCRDLIGGLAAPVG